MSCQCSCLIDILDKTEITQLLWWGGGVVWWRWGVVEVCVVGWRCGEVGKTQRNGFDLYMIKLSVVLFKGTQSRLPYTTPFPIY